MIVDTLDNAGRYTHLGPCFAVAFEYIATHDIYALPYGRTEIDGEAVFANRGEGELTGEESNWEAHRRYADIQIVLKGRERFGWGASCDRGEYVPQKDFFPCAEVDGKFINLSAGQFCVFLAKEPHSPGNYVKKGERSDKVIFKVSMEE